MKVFIQYGHDDRIVFRIDEMATYFEHREYRFFLKAMVVDENVDRLIKVRLKK